MTHDLAEWKDEIAWMSLYFSLAVWSSLALCVFYALEDHLPQYRTEAAIVSVSPTRRPVMVQRRRADGERFRGGCVEEERRAVVPWLSQLKPYVACRVT